MKKVILFVFAVVMAVSCSLDGGYQKYEIRTTFEYRDQMGVDYEQTFGKDSVYFDTVGKSGAYWGDLLFHQKISDAGQFLGGFALSYLAPSGMGEKKADYVYNDYKVAGPKLPANQINTYAVFYQNPDAAMMPQNSISFLPSQYATCVLNTSSVNNTESVYYAAKKNYKNGIVYTLTLAFTTAIVFIFFNINKVEP